MERHRITNIFAEEIPTAAYIRPKFGLDRLENMIERLKKILTDYKTQYFRILNRPENKDLLDFINSWYDFPENTKLRTKIFWVFNDIHEIPKCRNCGNEMPINSISYKTNRYYDYCGNKCATSSVERNNKRIRTNITKYGGNAPVCSDAVKEKMKQTCVEKYGTEFSFQSENVKSKIRETNLKKYGVLSPM